MTYTDTIEVGPAPADEECVQVGEEQYDKRAWDECQRFIDLIRKTVGTEPAGARLSIQWNAHDFGSYCEVVVKFDRYMDSAVDYAFRVDQQAPRKWS